MSWRTWATALKRVLTNRDVREEAKEKLRRESLGWLALYGVSIVNPFVNPWTSDPAVTFILAIIGIVLLLFAGMIAATTWMRGGLLFSELLIELFWVVASALLLVVITDFLSLRLDFDLALSLRILILVLLVMYPVYTIWSTLKSFAKEVQARVPEVRDDQSQED